MQFLRKEGDHLIIQNLFNSQHAEELIKAVEPSFSVISFKNVGIKIMRLILAYFEQVHINQVNIQYNWNQIMINPKLVCYDKSQWKTLQQLSNWNREWKELFTKCYYLSTVFAKIECTWMDAQFAQHFLQGVANIPNIQVVGVNFSSKNQEVENVLSAFSKAQIFGKYEYHFTQSK